MRLRICLFLSAIAAIGCGKSQTESTPSANLAEAGPQLQALSTFRFAPNAQGCPTAHSVNTRYFLIQDDTGLTGMVFRETVDISQCLTAEASTSKVTVSAWRAGQSQSARPAFGFEAPGEQGEMVDRTVYRITERGCCGPSNLDRYFSLENGAEVFSATGRPLRVRVAGDGDRWIAVQDSYSATAIQESERDSTIVGLIQYGDGRVPSLRLAVAHPRGGFYGLDSLYFVRGVPMRDSSEILVSSARGDPRQVQVSGFSIVAVLVAREWDGVPLRVEIPIESDRPQVQRARLSGHATLRVVSGRSTRPAT